MAHCAGTLRAADRDWNFNMGGHAALQIHWIKMNVPIKDEADARELRQVISAFGMQTSDNFLTNDDIEKCLALLPKSIGYWLANSEPNEDGVFRGEMHNGLIVHAVPRQERSGIAFGRPYTSPEHFDFYVKFHGSALDELTEQMGKSVKNG